jgi:hypothetical protein
VLVVVVVLADLRADDRREQLEERGVGDRVDVALDGDLARLVDQVRQRERPVARVDALLVRRVVVELDALDRALVAELREELELLERRVAVRVDVGDQRLLDIGGEHRRQHQRADDVRPAPAVIFDEILKQIRHRQEAARAGAAGDRRVDHHVDHAVLVVAERVIRARHRVEDALERAQHARAVLLEVVVDAEAGLDADLTGAGALCIAELVVRVHPLREHLVLGQLLLAALALHVGPAIERGHEEPVRLRDVLHRVEVGLVRVDADDVDQVLELGIVRMPPDLPREHVDRLATRATEAEEDRW